MAKIVSRSGAMALVSLFGCYSHAQPPAVDRPTNVASVEPVTAAGESRSEGDPDPGGVLTAKGAFRAKAGLDIFGNVALTQKGSAVHFAGSVQGATPGLHGIHIHAVGDCSAPDFSSAGAHFNPTGAPHACPPTEPRHAGDLGNIEIGSDGRGVIDIMSSAISLAPGATSVRGLAVILHDAKDDCISQPAGGSGMRVACAIIEAE